MTHKISVNQNKCIGCGACAASCEESFEMRGGKAHFVKYSNCAEAAAEECPVGAISIS